MRPGVGIGGVDVDVLYRHAERLGADLPRHRLHALAEIDRRQSDGELTARIGMDQSLAGVAAEIHADRVIDRGDAAPAMLGHFCHRLLVPNTEENRGAPWDDPVGAAGAGCGARGGGEGAGWVGEGAGWVGAAETRS